MSNQLKLLPLLLIYGIIVFAFQKNELWGDEPRFLMYANNLSEGSYLPDYTVYLWNGPGYPLVLAPFMLFKLPWLVPKLMNAVFLFLSVLLFYRTLKIYLTERHAILFVCLFGIYLPFLSYIHLLMSEVFTIFLMSGFIFYFCKLHQADKSKWSLLFLSSGFLGYLALTKIFFGYVLLAGLLLFMMLYILQRRMAFRKTLLVYLVALLFCLPYLMYTYSLTGKVFYWGQSGGMSLYWMSSPYEKDLGDWYNLKEVMQNPELSKNHMDFFNELKGLSFTEQDERFKERALKNIVNNPLKFLKNWIANVGRLLFNYPYSYTTQKLSTYFYMLPNMFLVVFFILSIHPAYKGRILIPHEIYALLFFGIISFLGSSLLSAYNRMFTPLVPLFFLWILYTLVQVQKTEVEK